MFKKKLIDANKSLQIDFIMFSSFMRYEYLLSNYTEPKSSSITKENLIRLLPKLGMKFQENTLEEAEITENLYDYEIAYKLSFINYGINLNKTLNQNQT